MRDKSKALKALRPKDLHEPVAINPIKYTLKYKIKMMSCDNRLVNKYL